MSAWSGPFFAAGTQGPPGPAGPTGPTGPAGAGAGVPAARFCPTAALPAYAISNGGATLTMAATGALAAQDGVTPALGDTFLYVLDAAHGGVDNGPWTITTLGAPGVAMVATRASALPVAAHARGFLVSVSGGTANGGSLWECTSDTGADVVATSALAWARVGGVSAGIALAPGAVKTAAYAIAASDTEVRYDTTAGGFALTLPAAAAVPAGRVIATQDASGANGTNSVTFLPSGSDTIEGQPSLNSGTPYAAEWFESDGASKWTRAVKTLDPQWKNPVLAAQTVALPAYTVSASKLLLTANANGALPAIDGVAVGLSKPLLFAAGAAFADNGVYVVQQAGDAGTPWVLRRRADADLTGRVTQQTRVAVQQGTLFGGAAFAQLAPGPIVPGTTAQVWQPLGALLPLYVDATLGSDANSGLLPTAPVQTLLRAVRLAQAAGCAPHVRMADGTYSYASPGQVAFAAGVDPATGLPAPAIFTGGWTTPAVTGLVAAATANTAQITASGYAPTLNQWQGYWVQMTSGASVGKVSPISRNTTGGVFQLGTALSVGAGDTFSIIKPSVRVTHNGAAFACPSGVAVEGIDWDGSAVGADFQCQGGAPTTAAACRFVGSAGASSGLSCGRAFGSVGGGVTSAYGLTRGIPAVGAGGTTCVAIGRVSLYTGCTFSASGWAIVGLLLDRGRGRFVLNDCALYGDAASCAIQLQGGGTLDAVASSTGVEWYQPGVVPLYSNTSGVPVQGNATVSVAGAYVLTCAAGAFSLNARDRLSLDAAVTGTLGGPLATLVGGAVAYLGTTLALAAGALRVDGVSTQLAAVPGTVGAALGLSPAALGIPGTATAYAATGQSVPSVSKTASFTATPTEAAVYELGASCTVTLDSTLGAAQVFEFVFLASVSAPTVIFAPNNAKTITGPEGTAVATLTVTTRGTWRTVRRTSDGNWLMAGL